MSQKFKEFKFKKIRRNDKYKYIYTHFQHPQNSKRNQNWIPKNQCRTLHPESIKMLQISGLDTMKTSVHDHQYAEDVGNMTYIKTAKETTNVPTAKETTVAGLKIVKYGRKKKKLPD